MIALKAIIVDDEQDSRQSLSAYLTKYCPSVTILATCENIQTAKEAIAQHQPNLVFLDIEMPFGTGFDLLETYDTLNFEVIFVTAFSEYAIQAFNLSATHYLLKPIDIDELEIAVAKVQERLQTKSSINHAQVLLNNLQNHTPKDKRLVLPTMEGFEVVALKTVVYCSADDNFTCFHFEDNSKTLICRSLKHYEQQLSTLGFCRIHRSYLINMAYIKKYNKGKGGSVALENNEILPIAQSKKEAFLKMLLN